ncbi:MAG: hypothetical protein KGN02_02265 [bacterium]|nr:hypothetical protein [bacterium]
MTPSQNPTKVAYRRFVLEMSVAMGAYFVVLLASRAYFSTVAQPWLTVAALAPAIPLLAAFVSVAKMLRATDEFKRKMIVDSAAFAGSLTALLAATYGFAEGPGMLPHPSAWATWFVFMTLWFASALLIKARYR